MESNNLAELGVEFLESPYKSASDKKEYRVVRLSNGLTALLISDLHSLNEQCVENEEQLSDEESNDEGETTEEEQSGDEDDDDSNVDELENGLEGRYEEINNLNDVNIEMEEEEDILPSKSRKTRYLAAVSLCVGVGSFEDPFEIQGLMHFLEHMVFMGSTKYPKENCFDNFVKRSGGSDNAHTDYETTTFYFEIQEAHFEKGLDMFAEFFVAPLMKKEAMKRERKAVNSEFQESINDDDCRKQQIFASIAKEGHPMSLFTFGNENTLHLNIADSELHSKLHKIRSQFYSAQHMTVAIQGRETLDNLVNLTVKIFSKIPNNMLPRPSYQHYGLPFSLEKFHKLYKVIPVSDLHILDVSWALPPLFKYYEYKPLHYISHLIGHEGLGSILSYFKKRLWGIDIYAGNDETGYEHNSTYALFHIRIHLTNEGFAHVKEVLLVIFQYIKLLQNVGPVERIFSEIQKVEQLDFDFAEGRNPYENVESLSEDMQRFPPLHYLAGANLLFKYEPEIIKRCLSLLQPSSCNIMMSSRDYEADGICSLTEKWFGTKYCTEDIPAEWPLEWEQLSLNPELYLPSPNIFIPDSFDIVQSDCSENVPKYPLNIISDFNGELWFKRDIKFNLPRAYCYVYFYFDHLRESAKMGAMLDLFLNLYHQQIMELLYPASMAQYESIIKADDWGFVVNVNGFNQKLYKCLEMLVNEMKDFGSHLDNKAFVEMKEQQMKSYHNAILNPDTLRRDTRLVLLQEVHWQVAEKMKALHSLTLVDFSNEFVNKIFSHKYIRTLIQGNITEAEAVKIHSLFTQGTILKHSLKCPEMRTRQWPVGEWITRIKGLNPGSTNTSVVNYYQGNAGSLYSEILNEFIIMAMDEPVFDTLRTKDQLGYHVYCTNRNTYGILGISITVNSQADKYSSNHIDERIESFLKVFSENLKNISQKELTTLKDTLKSHKITVDVTLKDEVERNWNEIVSGEFLFDRYQQQVELIPKITGKAASQYLNNLVSPVNNPHYRKLTVQIVGSSDTSEAVVPCHEDTLKSKSENLVDYVPPNEEDFQMGRTESQFITNLRGFAKRLSFYPVSKIIRKMHIPAL